MPRVPSSMDDRTPVVNDGADPSVRSWLPHPSLSIGVTGHRLERLGEINIGAVSSAVSGLLGAIESAVRNSCPLPTAPSLRLVSALAQGADSIAADAALARGWELDVVLPFARETYATDFPEGEPRTAYEGRLAAAHAVFELPGDRKAPDGSAVAYERAGRIVLAQSDVLIAVWDGGPVLGRGGAAQIVAEAVLQNIPVIHIDPTCAQTPILLWGGLEEHDLGQQTIDTVARGTVEQLPLLLCDLLNPPAAPEQQTSLRLFGRGPHGRWTLAIAYPLLLAVMGVRKFRRSDFHIPGPDGDSHLMPTVDTDCTPRAGDFDRRLCEVLSPRFARADAIATHVAQLFRSGYVTNFSFAALAVVLSLLSLALPLSLKPILIVAELIIIAVILILTRAGNRAAWLRRWLDNRQLAERLRCLSVAAQLGELNLRGGSDSRPDWVSWYTRATASELGLPSIRVGDGYLRRVQHNLLTLIEGQIEYLTGEALRMHRLEHRLHNFGTTLFALTALICVWFFVFAAAQMTLLAGLDQLAHPLAVAVTITSAALPAMGAAIYGIRMQGDFAGIAERGHTLSHHLAILRKVISEDVCSFDTLWRRTARVTDLLTEDLASWLQTYHARPLNLPG
jgi:hypothetical protein